MLLFSFILQTPDALSRKMDNTFFVLLSHTADAKGSVFWK